MQAYCEDICIYLAIHKLTPKLLPLCTSPLIKLAKAICEALAALKDAEALEYLCLAFSHHPFSWHVKQLAIAGEGTLAPRLVFSIFFLVTFRNCRPLLC